MIKKLFAVLSAAVMLTSLAACTDSGQGSGDVSPSQKETETMSVTETEAAAEDTTVAPAAEIVTMDFGWVHFEAPAYFIDTQESEQYVTLINENDKNQMVKISRDILYPDQTIDFLVMQQISNNTEKYEKGADAAFGGFSWQTVNFRENGLENRMFFADAGDGEHFLKLTAFGLTENDYALQVITGSIAVDAAQL